MCFENVQKIGKFYLLTLTCHFETQASMRQNQQKQGSNNQYDAKLSKFSLKKNQKDGIMNQN